MKLEYITEIIASLLKERFGSVKAGLTECGVSCDLIANMKKGSFPSIEKILPIAEYLDISVDYLLGREQIPSSLSDLEKELIKYFRSLDNDGQTAILRAAKNEYQARGSNAQHSRIVESLKRQDYAADSKASQR